jgi:hypothetical protein
MRTVAGHLINTPLQWGARGTVRELNRFNGLFGAGETVETVIALSLAVSTPLKWGVNESNPGVLIRRYARLQFGLVNFLAKREHCEKIRSVY